MRLLLLLIALSVSAVALSATADHTGDPSSSQDCVVVEESPWLWTGTCVREYASGDEDCVGSSTWSSGIRVVAVGNCVDEEPGAVCDHYRAWIVYQRFVEGSTCVTLP